MNPTVEVNDFSLFELSKKSPSRRFQLSQAGDRVTIHKLILVSHLSPGARWLEVLARLELRFCYLWSGGESQSVVLHPLLWVSPVQLHPVFTGFQVPASQSMGFGSMGFSQPSSRRIEQIVIELVLREGLPTNEDPVLQVAYLASPSITLAPD
jgi:hypothetical protein